MQFFMSSHGFDHNKEIELKLNQISMTYMNEKNFKTVMQGSILI